MLVLSRKSGQVLNIGDDIQLSVLEVKGNRIRIGIEAPAHCRILRGELIVDLADGEPHATDDGVEEISDPRNSIDRDRTTATRETARLVSRPRRLRIERATRPRATRAK